MSRRGGAAARTGAALVGALLSLGFGSPAEAPRRITIPLACTRGPSNQEHDVTVTVPAKVSPGSQYRVRVDGVDTGKISHLGLKYIFDMESEWPIPPGTRYVEGSAHVVPGTGSENVRPGARVVVAAGIVHMMLPAHVENGVGYTTPSFEFDLAVVSAEGASITQRFARYSVSAHAFLVGDLRTTCEPAPKVFPVAVTRVESGG
jgi:hypothetical protein